ncbi:MAG: hypothetical protein KJ606_08720 [Chloroflexi bacterium]|nr:hypothetical protein [Chloroflexota bacterium]
MNTHGNPDNGKFEGIGRKPRGALQRVVITGKLTLETPARFGSGDVEGLTDMPLLRDPVDNKPLLPGASIAGALRNYLRDIERGYEKEDNPKSSNKSFAERLFGHLDDSIPDKKASLQSWLLIDDALGETPGIEIRDGVALDTKTRTAAEGKKFDIELLEAGTTFDLSFELVLKEGDESLQDTLVYALYGLELGEIGLGQRKKRGLGRCKAGNWSVCTFDLSDPKELVEWLDDDRSRAQRGDKILELLKPQIELTDERDMREWFTIEAEYELESSLLIRSSSGKADSPDMVHLSSRRHGEPEPVPILSGTSLAGAVRARALRIANTVVPDEADSLINKMFGQHIEGRGDKPTGSRVVTRETRLRGARDLVQTRVKIDRFTGGSFPQALFTQQPAFGGEGSRVKVHLTLRNPKAAEIGLLLLVLKDLWTGDLPLGGESSVGRGRLRGLNAHLTLRQGGQEKKWHIAKAADGLDVTGSIDNPKDKLENFVNALQEERKEAK